MFERDYDEPLGYQLRVRRGAEALQPARTPTSPPESVRAVQIARRPATRRWSATGPAAAGARTRCWSRCSPPRSPRWTCCAPAGPRTSASRARRTCPASRASGRRTARLVWFATSAGMAPGDGSMAEQAAVAADVHGPAARRGRARPWWRRWDCRRSPPGWRCAGAASSLAGEQVVVLGAGGVVGQAAVQIARHSGARRVVAVARSLQAQSRAAAAGADAVVATGHRGRRDAGRPDRRRLRRPGRPRARPAVRGAGRRRAPARCGPAGGW